ncbi:hypothetical protein H4Q26_017321 [Puccinia striiformis f. sp. tritici PST-130]|nr:hypothetical protein H4Q26_002650 [Puccinia striiformis f. sp. tritici PST-130]KAI9627537.1 hypothetical protein H4Q26_017321 [Puccinia striiformis f. sp. tritici PST-130]
MGDLPRQTNTISQALASPKKEERRDMIPTCPVPFPPCTPTTRDCSVATTSGSPAPPPCPLGNLQHYWYGAPDKPFGQVIVNVTYARKGIPSLSASVNHNGPTRKSIGRLR